MRNSLRLFCAGAGDIYTCCTRARGSHNPHSFWDCEPEESSAEDVLEVVDTYGFELSCVYMPPSHRREGFIGPTNDTYGRR